MSFTPKLLEKRMSVSEERALEIIHALEKYKLIQAAEIELDDEEITLYSFIPNPSFAAVMTIAGEIIKKPNCFEYFNGGRSTPYL